MLNNCFEYGQAYVALSRVTDRAGLVVNGRELTKEGIKAHPKVLAFYEELEEVGGEKNGGEKKKRRRTTCPDCGYNDLGDWCEVCGCEDVWYD